MKHLLYLLVLALVFHSCATKKEIIYFQDVDKLSDQQIGAQFFEPVIEPNDILYITVSSFKTELLAPYVKITAQSENNRDPQLEGYLVSSSGTIQYPGLGAVNVQGMTRTEIINELTERLTQFVTDVTVDVRILNFKVTVLGEVQNPGVYTIKDERLTVPQALGLAGDLTSDGKRNNIMILRQVEGNQRVARIDITNTDFLSSPYYFLKQNDIIYVEPSTKGVKKSGFIPDVPALLSLASVVLSVVIILTR